MEQVCLGHPHLSTKLRLLCLFIVVMPSNAKSCLMKTNDEVTSGIKQTSLHFNLVDDGPDQGIYCCLSGPLEVSLTVAATSTQSRVSVPHPTRGST